MIKRMFALALALIVCALAFSGCLQSPAIGAPAVQDTLDNITDQLKTAPGSLNLNGMAYVATLSINGLPFTGALARQDASAGWSFRLSGEQAEHISTWGVDMPRTWIVSIDLSKKGLTADPNGYYTGKASISLKYDMQQFDREAFGLVRDARGEGADFDYKKIKGWFSHGENKPSVLTQLWESEDFTLYFGGLGDGRAYLAKTMGHTLSYLPQSSELSLSHRLYYDLPEAGDTYIYSLEADESQQAILLRLKDYKGKGKKTIPKEPLESIGLSGAFDALAGSNILLELEAK